MRKQHLASIVFGIAVITGWTGMWLAQATAPAREESRLTSLPASELQGVTHIVFDVDPQLQSRHLGETLVLAGWQGDLRLTTTPDNNQSSLPLSLIREGHTVFVRVSAESMAAAAQASEKAGEDTSRAVIDTPVSLTLPASISDISWPSMSLLMARSANMPALTVRTYALTVGSNDRRYNRSSRTIDSQIEGDLENEIIPGRLEHLTVLQSRLHECPDKRYGRAYQGAFQYDGGFFSRIDLLTQARTINIATMEPDMQLKLSAAPDTQLSVAKMAYLKQLQTAELSPAQIDLIEKSQREDPSGECRVRR